MKDYMKVCLAIGSFSLPTKIDARLEAEKPA